MTDIVERLRKREMLTEIGQDRPEIYRDAANEIERLRNGNATLQGAFRVNMLRAFPNMSHEEIDAEIKAALKETGDD